MKRFWITLGGMGLLFSLFALVGRNSNRNDPPLRGPLEASVSCPSEVAVAVPSATAVRQESPSTAGHRPENPFLSEVIERFPALREQVSYSPTKGEGALHVALPTCYSEGLTISHSGVSLKQSLMGASPAEREETGTVSVYRNVGAGVDALVVREPHRVEEYLRIAPGSVREFFYEFRIDSSGGFFQNVEGLEACDETGISRLHLGTITYRSPGDEEERPAETDLVLVDARTARLSIRIPAADAGTEVLLDPGWSLTGAMPYTGYGYVSATYTLLGNGDVLTGGGLDTSIAETEKRAFLYSASSGTWSSVGSMRSPREHATATLLPNGKVLVAGGAQRRTSGMSAYRTCELYDPAKKTWSSTGSMAKVRYGHSAVLLANGLVLVAGGNPSPQYICELYNPATGTWSPTGSILSYKISAHMFPLPNGRILLLGSVCQLYDPAAGTWTTTGTMVGPYRSWSTASQLADGRILVAGGIDSNIVAANTCEMYDWVTGTWSVAGSMLSSRSKHAASLLPDGRVLVISGTPDNGDYNYMNACEAYDPATGLWSAAAPVNYGRGFGKAIRLANGKVLFAGGYLNFDAPQAVCELYTP